VLHVGACKPYRCESSLADYLAMQAAQKLAPLLEFLRRHTGLALQVVLHPESELSDLPLKSYYRFALPEFAGGGE
jgi:hypothetical protein